MCSICRSLICTQTLMQKPRQKESLGRPRCIHEEIVKTWLHKNMWYGMNWLRMRQKLAFLHMVVTYKFLYKFEISWSDVHESNCQGKLLLFYWKKFVNYVTCYRNCKLKSRNSNFFCNQLPTLSLFLYFNLVTFYCFTFLLQ